MALRSNNFVYFICFIFLPSIILILINHCDGSPSLWGQYANQCNGTIGECPLLVEENEEFLMDTEELARIAAKKRVLLSQDRKNPGCDKKCQGAYNAGNRPCTNANYCGRG
ncbi:hypothetical protein L2E82_44110 [Cichorium intybus]|uniref:Uncharacterized protein n=1 Tax=Cichorium intybus TaxID=13427 RepID=A0ACB8ZPP8_CICIN|nr:hypothetical protein L2E82_44110 [Cichorium intybus]